MKKRIRYKYTEAKAGFKMSEVKCPVCKSTHINWTKVVEHKSWAGRVVLLAECWSGEVDLEKPRHLFLIELEDLPIVELSKI